LAVGIPAFLPTIAVFMQLGKRHTPVFFYEYE